MERSAIADVVFDLVTTTAGVDPSTLSEATTQDDLGLDSILLVDLMLTAEDRLGFSFRSMDIPRNPSIGDIIDMIDREIHAG